MHSWMRHPHRAPGFNPEDVDLVPLCRLFMKNITLKEHLANLKAAIERTELAIMDLSACDNFEWDEYDWAVEPLKEKLLRQQKQLDILKAKANK